MPKTQIADVIVPEVFNPYVVQRTAELSALYQSGIISTSAELNRLASGGGRLINMPFWDDLDGNDLAKALSGDDPMQQIGNLVASYWARRWQALLISMLTGVFASPTTADNLHDISNAANGGDVITANTTIDALQRLGDAKDKLTAFAMHSAVVAKLAKDDLITFVKPSSGAPEIPTFLGKRVITDDGCPVNAGVYDTYIFGSGAIGWGEGAAPVPTETDRDSLAGDDILINRRHFVLHPRGVRWNDTVIAGSSPTNVEVANANNWTRVYDPKNVRIVLFRHTIV